MIEIRNEYFPRPRFRLASEHKASATHTAFPKVDEIGVLAIGDGDFRKGTPQSRVPSRRRCGTLVQNAKALQTKSARALNTNGKRNADPAAARNQTLSVCKVTWFQNFSGGNDVKSAARSSSAVGSRRMDRQPRYCRSEINFTEKCACFQIVRVVALSLLIESAPGSSRNGKLSRAEAVPNVRQ